MFFYVFLCKKIQLNATFRHHSSDVECVQVLYLSKRHPFLVSCNIDSLQLWTKFTFLGLLLLDYGHKSTSDDGSKKID